jgi:hypothetical protein
MDEKEKLYLMLHEYRALRREEIARTGFQRRRPDHGDGAGNGEPICPPPRAVHIPDLADGSSRGRADRALAF